MKSIACLVFFLLVATACKEVFDAPPTSRMKASLKNSETKKDTSSVITILALGRDSLFYNQEKASSFILPLSPDQSTAFLITFDGVKDTIIFLHETMIRYASMESGFYNEFKLKQLTTTHHKISSIQITDSLVTNTLHENIKLYIRPLPAGSK